MPGVPEPASSSPALVFGCKETKHFFPTHSSRYSIVGILFWHQTACSALNSPASWKYVTDKRNSLWWELSILSILKIYFIWSYITHLSWIKYKNIKKYKALKTENYLVGSIAAALTWSGNAIIGGGGHTASMVCSTLGWQHQLVVQCCDSIQLSFSSMFGLFVDS